MPELPLQRLRTVWCGIGLVVAAIGCSDDSTPPSTTGSRSYRMGFSAIPPKADQEVALSTIALWTARADAAIMSVRVPYYALLEGNTARVYLRAFVLPLAQYYRAKKLQLTVRIDPVNGLDRSAESPELAELGRSITETSIQQLYREYVSAMDSILHPTY